MSNKIDPGVQIRQGDRLQHSFDYALRFISPSGTIEVVSGWVDLQDTTLMIAVDEEGGNPSQVLTNHWPRPDVDKELGRQCSPSQKGYGFIGVIRDHPARAQMNFYAAAPGILRPIGSTSMADFQCRETFIDKLLEIPIPWQYAQDAYSIIQKSGIPQSQPGCSIDSPAQRGEIGNPLESPKYSVLLPAFENAANFATQVMLLSEDDAFRSAGEIIVLLSNDESADNVIRDMGLLYDLHGLPLRWIQLPGYVSYAEAINFGSATARGQIGIFYNSNILPEHATPISNCCQSLSANPQIAALTCDFCDISGLRWSGSNEILLTTDFGGYAVISEPVPGSQPKGGGTLNPDFFAFRMDDFKKAGAMNIAYVTPDMTVKDLCQRLEKAGRSTGYCSSCAVTALNRPNPETNPDTERRRRLWDAAAYKNEWHLTA